MGSRRPGIRREQTVRAEAAKRGQGRIGAAAAVPIGGLPAGQPNATHNPAYPPAGSYSHRHRYHHRQPHGHNHGHPHPHAHPFPPPIPTYDYEILAVYPHDPTAFTQGLVYDNGQLLEGTGRRGQSTLRRVDLATGRVRQQIPLAPDLFGEGITLFQEQIYQLTWQEHTGFVYDAASFALQRQFSYPTEGWGLTHDGRQLIMSDGSSTLYFLDPAGLTITGQVTVFDDQGPVNQLNELEYVQGEVWANVWHTDTIVRIDPATGRVVGRIDLTGLLRDVPANQPVDVLNGIAYDPAGDRLFVTGKLWPHLYEIRLHPRP